MPLEKWVAIIGLAFALVMLAAAISLAVLLRAEHVRGPLHSMEVPYIVPSPALPKSRPAGSWRELTGGQTWEVQESNLLTVLRDRQAPFGELHIWVEPGDEVHMSAAFRRDVVRSGGLAPNSYYRPVQAMVPEWYGPCLDALQPFWNGEVDRQTRGTATPGYRQWVERTMSGEPACPVANTVHEPAYHKVKLHVYPLPHGRFSLAWEQAVIMITVTCSFLSIGGGAVCAVMVWRRLYYGNWETQGPRGAA